MNSKDVDDFILKHGITKLAPDPKLSQCHVGELASSWSSSGLARGLARANYRKEKKESEKIEGYSKEKEKLKRYWEKNRKRMRTMQKDPPTSKQIDFLKNLGNEKPNITNKAQAHYLITQALKLKNKHK